MAKLDQPLISYGHVSEFRGWAAAAPFLMSIIDTHKPKSILEIGSGANPTLSRQQIPEGTEYITSDADAEELSKAESGHVVHQLDLEQVGVPDGFHNKFDLVFSRMVNEHVRDGREYHKNILSILAPGGIAVHCFATLYALPFVLNKLIPNVLSNAILNYAHPRDQHRHGKFPAYYGWSRGPTKHMIRQYQELGYEVLRYNGYFGHWYYLDRLKVLDAVEHAKARLLIKLQVPMLCSYATIILRKPNREGS